MVIDIGENDTITECSKEKQRQVNKIRKEEKYLILQLDYIKYNVCTIVEFLYFSIN